MNLKRLLEIVEEQVNPKTCILNVFALVILIISFIFNINEPLWLLLLIFIFILLNLLYSLIYLRYICKKLYER